MMEVKGVVHKVEPIKQVSDKFKLREFVVKTDLDTQYPQYVTMQVTNDKCGLLDKYPVGSMVNCHINLRGKEYKNKQGEIKYFNSIEAWKIDKVENAAEFASDLGDQPPF